MFQWHDAWRVNLRSCFYCENLQQEAFVYCEHWLSMNTRTSTKKTPTKSGRRTAPITRVNLCRELCGASCWKWDLGHFIRAVGPPGRGRSRRFLRRWSSQPPSPLHFLHGTGLSGGEVASSPWCWIFACGRLLDSCCCCCCFFAARVWPVSWQLPSPARGSGPRGSCCGRGGTLYCGLWLAADTNGIRNAVGRTAFQLSHPTSIFCRWDSNGGAGRRCARVFIRPSGLSPG